MSTGELYYETRWVRGTFEGTICTKVGATQRNWPCLRTPGPNSTARIHANSAFGWGPKGRWFKSSRPDYRKPPLRRGFLHEPRTLGHERRGLIGVQFICDLQARQPPRT